MLDTRRTNELQWLISSDVRTNVTCMARCVFDTFARIYFGIFWKIKIVPLMSFGFFPFILFCTLYFSSILFKLRIDYSFYKFFIRFLDNFLIYKLRNKFSGFQLSPLLCPREIRDSLPLLVFAIFPPRRAKFMSYRTVKIGRRVNKNILSSILTCHFSVAYKSKPNNCFPRREDNISVVNYPRNYPTGSLMTFALEKVSHNYFLS